MRFFLFPSKKSKRSAFFGQISHPGEPKTLMLSVHPEVFINDRIIEFFTLGFDTKRIRQRCMMFHRSILQDQDRIRLHGQYYNNIYLGKRIFGPARKQIYAHSILGGMERRYEIIENQINHIPFTHDASDKHKEKCRNHRIKCRDDTRVVLTYPTYDDAQNFIHANRVSTPMLFNDFIITQAPMNNTSADFWRMVWQENVRYIFMLISKEDTSRYHPYWPTVKGSGVECGGFEIVNEDVDDSRDPFFKVTTLTIYGPNERKLVVEHWQGNLNDTAELNAPLRLLQVSRNCSAPTIVHDHLGISRAAALVAIEIAICNLLRGPIYKFPVQQAVHFLRSFRAFSIETPMQYIYIHRVLLTFMHDLIGDLKEFETDYTRWLGERALRAFATDSYSEAPPYRLLSPRIDPDLLALVRHKDRPEGRREIHAHVGELPLPLENIASSPVTVIPKMYPKGKRY